MVLDGRTVLFSEQHSPANIANKNDFIIFSYSLFNALCKQGSRDDLYEYIYFRVWEIDFMVGIWFYGWPGETLREKEWGRAF